ncbi:hypothetical protein KY385_02940 [Candidatus Parcubacteria bacterium]|nr:hypothetical protein [Candidatus Parcubacteria bacterium]
MRFAIDYLEKVPYEILNDPVESQASAEEITARIGKYLVMERLSLPCKEETRIKIARNEMTESKTFVTLCRIIWRSKYKSREGLTAGDIELTADALGVYEDIWPMDPDEEARALLPDPEEALVP